MALVNLADYEAHAREAISGSVLDYCDGGANDEITLRDNPAAFARIPLYPRVFRGTDRRDTSTVVLDFPLAIPVVAAPVALLGMIHPDGEAPVARATTRGRFDLRAQHVLCDAGRTGRRGRDRTVWFQLYVYKDRAATEALVKRVEAAGCSALELTADTPILGQRERDARNSFELPEGLWTPNLTADGAQIVPEPGGGVSPFAASVNALLDPGLTWDDVAWLRSITTLPVLVKGIVRADDERRRHALPGLVRDRGHRRRHRVDPPGRRRGRR